MYSIYSPIVRQSGGRFQKHGYNDARLAVVGKQLLARMVSKQSNVVHQITENAAEEKRFYRFLSNRRVNPGEMIDQLYRPSINNLSDRHLIVIGDSSEVSLKKHISHIQDRDRVGVLSDNKTPGFYLHSQLVLDAESGHGLGLSDLLFWMRKKSSPGKDKGKDRRSWLEKESYRWLQGINHSQALLGQSKTVLYVFDSGADIANLWANAQAQGYDLLIRSQSHDRPLINGKLSTFLDSLEVAGDYELPLSKLSRRNISQSKAQQRIQRVAKMEVRFSPVVLKLQAETGKVDLPLYVVDAREKVDSVPEGEDPVHWKLLTTRPVEVLKEAMQIIQYYEWRWQTEELYRTSKKKGFGIEQTELTTLDAIFKQTILSLEAAFRVMRLVICRDKGEQQPIDEVFSPDEVKCLEVLNQKYEGKTEKLQNPWPREQLAWAAWVIARIGGWKGYQSRTPTGPIRMKRGLDKFNIYFDAWNLFQTEVDVGDP